MSRPLIKREQFLSLFLNDTALLDVRAEGEFAKGCFPCSGNVPILNDEERHLVGVCYKNRGQQKAIALGHQLVSGDLKAARIGAWCDFIKASPSTAIYCWRGGMRSHLSQEWIKQAGVDIALIEGGFKALRHFLLTELESMVTNTELVIVGGRTGSAKTPLINALPTGVDLEGHANHRGSSFGRRVEEPPSQINFEHQLIINLIKLREQYSSNIVFLEDESQRIGPIVIPLTLWRKMEVTPVIELEVPFEERVQHILQEYVVDLREEYAQVFNDAEAYLRYKNNLLESLFRIRKKLGNKRYDELKIIMDQAFEQQLVGDISLHVHWISALLKEYYDPMYDYQLKKKNNRVLLKGDRETIMAWAVAKNR